TALPHIESGDLKALAVTTKERSPALPDVPTVAEAGLPNYEFSAWYAVLAPAGTPGDVRQKLNKAVNAVLAKPDVTEQLRRLGAQPLRWSIDETGAFIAQEYETWRKAITKAGLTID